jgi:hypothetical protein
MKRYGVLGMVLVTLVALSLLPVQAVSAQATVIPCQGAFIPRGVVSYGAWTYPDGNWHVRGMIALYEQDMPDSDYRCSGLNTVVTNANWNAYGVGPSWGTFHVVLAEGSPDGWDGTWTAMSYPGGASSICVVGHGVGDLEGMKVFVDIDFADLHSAGIANGYILDPHGE